MEESLMIEIASKLELDTLDPSHISPLVLAYIGDAFYEMIIRTKVVLGKQSQVNKLHKQSAMLVKASAQAGMIQRLMENLNEEEWRVYKRGRNANSHSVAKNSTIQDYRLATGFEALMGYLYLKNEVSRALDLVKMGLEMMENE